MESFPDRPLASTACARTLEWDCLRVDLAAQAAALAVLEGPRDWLDAVHAGLVADRAVALAAVDATPGLAAAVPAAAPFLFVHADSGEPGRAPASRAAGLPVVDGVHFQAPGYARLPFAGAAQRRRGARRRARALGRRAQSRELAAAAANTPRRTLAMISANSLTAAVQGQFMFVLPWMLLARGSSPQVAALAGAVIYVPMLVTALPAGAWSDARRPAAG